MRIILTWRLSLKSPEEPPKLATTQSILWRLFRMQAEEQEMPEEIPRGIRKLFQDCYLNHLEKQHKTV